MIAIPSVKCRQLACDFRAEYSDQKMNRRALNEHLASAHGIGRVKSEETHLGCFYDRCGFTVSGSARFTQDAFRDHLIRAHNVDPENPIIPAEARSGRWL